MINGTVLLFASSCSFFLFHQRLRVREKEFDFVIMIFIELLALDIEIRFAFEALFLDPENRKEQQKMRVLYLTLPGECRN